MGKSHVENLNWRDVAAQPWDVRGLPGGILWRPFSTDADNGAFTAIIELPEGFDSQVSLMPSEPLQVFVLEGALQIGPEILFPGAYCYHPAGSASGRWIAKSAVRALAIADASLDFERVEDGSAPSPDAIPFLDSWQLDWVDPLTASEPSESYRPGLMVKILRVDPETGASTHLAGLMAGWFAHGLEVHPIYEENYCLSGDVHLGEVDGGPGYTMTEGSYLCRPPGIPHGPVLSKNGNVNFCYTPAKLGIDYRPCDRSKELIAEHLHNFPWR